MPALCRSERVHLEYNGRWPWGSTHVGNGAFPEYFGMFSVIAKSSEHWLPGMREGTWTWSGTTATEC